MRVSEAQSHRSVPRHRDPLFFISKPRRRQGDTFLRQVGVTVVGGIILLVFTNAATWGGTYLWHRFQEQTVNQYWHSLSNKLTDRIIQQQAEIRELRATR